MPDREKVISDLQEYHDREWTDERMGGVHAREERKRITGDALALLKEQQEIIEQYHRADTFLDVHGWKW